MSGAITLTFIRNKWIEDLVEGVLRQLWPAAADRLEFTAPAQTAMWRALTLTHIACGDLMARPVPDIGRSLLSCGLLTRNNSPDHITELLVGRVVHKVRSAGVPGPRWWDAQGLHALLLELWTAQRAATLPPEVVTAELGRYWDITTPATQRRLMKVAADPYASLPAPLAEWSVTGRAVRVLEDATAFGGEMMKPSEHEEARHPLRSDLRILSKMARQYRLLKAVLRDLEGGANSDKQMLAADLSTDLDHWALGFTTCLKGLTSYEADLMAGRPTDEDYRDRCMNATSGIHVYDYLTPDALPASGEMARQPAPAWMQDRILIGGARMWHGRTGSMPLWLATAETAEHERLLGPLLRGEVQIARWTDGTFQHVDLQLDFDDGPPLSIPFVYNVAYITEAWQLLHLAAVGVVRLSLLRLTDEGRLLLIDTIALPLPTELCEDLTAAAITGLRELVDDDIQRLRLAFIPTAEEGALGTFDACERAKGEELLDEVTLSPPADVPDDRWQAFQQASRSVARRRAALIRADVPRRSSTDDPVLAELIERRVRMREGARSRIPVTSPEPTPQMKAASLPENTAFLHLYVRSGFLGAVWLARTDKGAALEQLDLSNVSVANVDEVVRRCQAAEAAGLFAVRLALLEVLHGLLADIAEPIVEALRPLGVRRLVLSPVAPFDLTPLHVAPVRPEAGAPTLMDVFDHVSYAPSMRILEAASVRTAIGNKPPLLVGVAEAPEGVSLPGVKAEIAVLRALHPAAVTLEGTDATPSGVLAAARGANRIHAACHGRTSEDRWANGIVLSGRSGGSDCLTVADVLADADFSGVDVAVLMACHTGAHRRVMSVVQTPRGFDAACFARGARIVVSTLWEVSDVTAMTFSVMFHAGLDMLDPAEAYRRAVGFLRHGGIAEDPAMAGAAILLRRQLPGWDAAIDTERQYGVWAWGAFKVTGLPRPV
ncbi:CHAT domain-containing protein [Micromonospora sp. NPDC005215]|uniref:CHAT domain-containing protein n=1 Tax=Micromonospora sp. NPDC005215 TaxID=3157024 RepID=UPI00339E1A80